MYFAHLFILLFLALAAHAQEQQKRVAILNTEDNGEPALEHADLIYLTDKLRGIALKTLPQDKYFVMTTQSIIDKMGSKENARKVCKEAQCIAEIGRKISAEYIGQARLGRFGGNFTISMELYHSARGNLIGSFTGESKDVFGLLTVLNSEAPQMFAGMPEAKAPPASASTVTTVSTATTATALSFKDSRDNKTYRIVKIGNQIWMAENLNYNASGSKCYDNRESNCQKYGRLYNWETAKSACPGGWHLPSKAEWEALTASVGGESTAGKFLKAKSGWNYNGNGEDKFGFSALPGGAGFFTGFKLVSDFGYWWTASGYNSDKPYYQSMNYEIKGVNWAFTAKGDLYSVRCLQDSP